jgi:PAS domain S-box-containing protein
MSFYLRKYSRYLVIAEYLLVIAITVFVAVLTVHLVEGQHGDQESHHIDELMMVAGLLLGLLGLSVFGFLRFRSNRMELDASEEALLKTQERFQSLVGNIPGIVYRCAYDADWTMDYISDGIEDLTGYPAADFLGKGKLKYAGFIHPDDRLHVFQKVTEGLDEERPFEIEYRIFGENNSIRWVIERGQGVFDSNGDILYLDGVILDQSERKRDQQETLDVKKRLELAVRGGNLGLWDWNIQDGSLKFNDRWAEMLGYNPDEIAPQVGVWERLTHPDDRPEVMNKMTEHLAGQTEYYVAERRLLTKSGEWRWVQDHGKVIESTDEGVAVRMVGVLIDIHERKLSELNLKESEQRLDLALEGASLGIWDWDARNNKGNVNETWAQMLGYEKDEIGDSLSEWKSLIHPDDYERVNTLYYDHLEGKTELYRSEHRLKTKSDGWCWVIDIGKVVERDDRGNPMRVVGIHVDINKLKSVERQLFEQEQQYRLIVETAAEGVVVLNRRNRIIYINSRIPQRLGYDGNELVGQPIGAIIDQSTHSSISEIIQKWEEAAENQIELKLRTKDGETFWALVSSSSIEKTEKNSGGRLLMITDINKRKQAENEVIRNREVFRKAVQAANGYAYEIKFGQEVEDKEYVYTDPKLAELLGISEGSITMHGLTSMVQEVTVDYSDHQGSADLYRLAQKNRELNSYNADMRIVTRDGRELWFSDHSIIQRDPETGEALGAFGILQDITARVKVENERRELSEKLRRAQKLESIGQLTGGIAHDFNNILMGIMGYTDLALMQSHQNREIHNLLSQIANAAQKASTLTNQLLAFSRRRVIQPVPVNLNQMITNLGSLMRRLIPENIEISFELDENLPNVLMDAGQFEPALVNLCVNARDAIERHGKIIVRTRRIHPVHDAADFIHAQENELKRPLSGPVVCLEVVDDGVGMSEELQKKVFEPFFTTKAVGEGTGLGLSMAYGLVEQHQGMIAVQSREGEGTTVRILLPSTEESTSESGTQVMDESLVGDREVIFVVEDDDTVRSLAVRILRNANYSVYDARDGEEAIEMLEKHVVEPDLVLLDAIMPKVDGSEVYNFLKSFDPSIHVLFTSGYPTEDLHIDFVVNEDINFLSKPYPPAKLLSKVYELLHTGVTADTNPD